MHGQMSVPCSNKTLSIKANSGQTELFLGLNDKESPNHLPLLSFRTWLFPAISVDLEICYDD